MKVVINPIRKNFDKNAITTLEQDLQQLGDFVKGAEVDIYLVGGVAIALTIGHFYRNHQDFDLAIFSEDLDKFYKYITSKSYEMVTRHLSKQTSLGYHLNLVSKTNPQMVLEKNQNYLRFLRRDHHIIQYTGNRMDYVDLFLLRKKEKTVYLVEHNLDIPSEEFFPVRSHALRSGSSLLIPNLAYRTRMKNTKQIDDIVRLSHAETFYW